MSKKKLIKQAYSDYRKFVAAWVASGYDQFVHDTLDEAYNEKHGYEIWKSCHEQWHNKTVTFEGYMLEQFYRRKDAGFFNRNDKIVRNWYMESEK